MTNFYGYNIHAQGLKKPTVLIEHIMKSKPTWSLVMNDLSLLQQLQVASKDTKFVHRNYDVTNGDDDVHLRYTPEQWIEAHKADIDANVWIMTTCESGWSQALIDWHVSLMRLCIPRKIKLVIGNWSVGTPEPGLIGMAKPILQLCADNPELFIIGLHEYAGGVITSGFVGGAPDGFTQSHDKQYHPDYQKQTSWPLNGEARILTKWLCGRFQFWVDYCKSVGIKPPRIVLTEAGFDAISDIGWWLNTLPKTEPYKVLSGFKTLQAYWKQILPQYSHDQAYFKQLEYAEYNIYDGTVVEGACLYCVGHKDVKWENDDLEGRTEFFGYMEEHAMTTTPPKPAPTVPAPAYLGIPKTITVSGGSNWNLRTEPDIMKGEVVGMVRVGEIINLYSASIQPNGGNNFYYVERATPATGESASGWLAYVLPSTAPLPTQPTPEPSLDARLYKAYINLSQALYEVAQLHKEKDEQNKLDNAA